MYGLVFRHGQKTYANVKTRREKNGQCADCGIQTHDIFKNAWGRQERIPLTRVYTNGGRSVSVVEGRCLSCNPMPGAGVGAGGPAATAAGATAATAASGAAGMRSPTERVRLEGEEAELRTASVDAVVQPDDLVTPEEELAFPRLVPVRQREDFMDVAAVATAATAASGAAGMRSPAERVRLEGEEVELRTASVEAVVQPDDLMTPEEEQVAFPRLVPVRQRQDFLDVAEDSGSNPPSPSLDNSSVRYKRWILTGILVLSVVVVAVVIGFVWLSPEESDDPESKAPSFFPTMPPTPVPTTQPPTAEPSTFPTTTSTQMPEAPPIQETPPPKTLEDTSIPKSQDDGLRLERSGRIYLGTTIALIIGAAVFVTLVCCSAYTLKCTQCCQKKETEGETNRDIADRPDSGGREENDASSARDVEEGVVRSENDHTSVMAEEDASQEEEERQIPIDSVHSPEDVQSDTHVDETELAVGTPIEQMSAVPRQSGGSMAEDSRAAQDSVEEELASHANNSGASSAENIDERIEQLPTDSALQSEVPAEINVNEMGQAVEQPIEQTRSKSVQLNELTETGALHREVHDTDNSTYNEPSLDSTKTIVFLSQTGRNASSAEFACMLQLALQARGIEAFLDETTAAPGMDTKEHIRRILPRCHVFIPILSREWFWRKWCMIELDLALQNELTVIPVYHSLPLKRGNFPQNENRFKRKMGNKGTTVEVKQWFENIQRLKDFKEFSWSDAVGEKAKRVNLAKKIASYVAGDEIDNIRPVPS